VFLVAICGVVSITALAGAWYVTALGPAPTGKEVV
jgi:hypothetical protein